MIDLGALPPREPVKHPSGPISAVSGKSVRKDDDSATEEDSGIEELEKAAQSTAQESKGKAAQTRPFSFKKSPSPEIEETVPPTLEESRGSFSPSTQNDRAPGRIIGNLHPLSDFKENIKQGDVVTEAVRDLGAVIKEVVTKPFASRRHQEMIECMIEMRRVALEQDEIDAWNKSGVLFSSYYVWLLKPFSFFPIASSEILKIVASIEFRTTKSSGKSYRRLGDLLV